jgi:hypothetical protein
MKMENNNGFKLYELANLYQKAESYMNENPNDESINDLFNSIEDSLEDKISNISMMIMNYQSFAKSIKDAEKGMKLRREAIENKIERLKKYTKECMQSSQKRKVENEYVRVSLRKNPHSVIIEDESLIDDDYMIKHEPPKPTPDKKKMIQDMKVGVVIDGASLIQTESLLIK